MHYNSIKINTLGLMRCGIKSFFFKDNIKNVFVEISLLVSYYYYNSVLP